MQFDWASLGALLRDSFRDPRGVARRLIAEDLSMEARWLAAAAVVALSVLVGEVTIFMLTVPTGGVMGGFLGAPVSAALLQGGMMIGGAFAIALVGRAFGGHGRFADALLLMAWLEFVMLVFQTAMFVVMLLFPFTAIALGGVAVVVFFWMLTQFTLQLHGFASSVKVFLCILGGFFVAAAVLGVVGLTPAQLGV